jgi:type II secretory pathway pseudopilin PulG
MAVHRECGMAREGRAEQGYVLLILCMFVAALTIAAAAVLPTIAFQIKRDREEELVHRGVQYSRAIRLYATKTGRYPFRLEDMCAKGDVKYLRRVYKDPITGGDFKVLHTTDIQSATTGANLNASGSQGGENGSGLNSPSGSAPAAAEQNSQDASTQPAGPSSGTAGMNSGAASMGSQSAQDPATAGGLIFGVVSSSKAKTIREFNHKNHYNDWLFFYSPPYGVSNSQIIGPTLLTPSNLQPQQPVQQVPASASNSPQGQSVQSPVPQ